jgi:hypothetical protein
VISAENCCILGANAGFCGAKARGFCGDFVVETWWKRGGALVILWWKRGGALVILWW